MTVLMTVLICWFVDVEDYVGSMITVYWCWWLCWSVDGAVVWWWDCGSGMRLWWALMCWCWWLRRCGCWWLCALMTCSNEYECWWLTHGADTRCVMRRYESESNAFFKPNAQEKKRLTVRHREVAVLPQKPLTEQLWCEWIHRKSETLPQDLAICLTESDFQIRDQHCVNWRRVEIRLTDAEETHELW